MQASLETLQGLERRLTITIPGQDVTQELEKRLKSLIKTVRIPGFRPGKVPLPLIRKQFSGQLLHEIAGELIKSSFNDAVKQYQLQLASQADFGFSDDEKAIDEDICYTATFEVYPEINLVPMGEWVINRQQVVIEEADVDAVVEDMRRQRQSWTPVERPARLGDRVTVDFTSTLSDGQAFAGNTGNDVLIVLGDGTFVAGFERHLVGAVVGETRSVEVTFPMGYHNQDIAGKTAVFNIVVKAVENALLPEVDATFIHNFGVHEGTTEALRQKVRAVMESNFVNQSWLLVKNQIIDALYQANPLEVPKQLLKEEIARLRSKAASDKYSNEAIENVAHRNVSVGLLLSHISTQQDFKASPERVREYIRNMSTDYDNPGEMERIYLSDNKLLKEVESAVIENMVMEWVMEQAQVKTSDILYSSLMVQARQKEIMPS